MRKVGLIAFKGWPDAGGVASSSISYIAKILKAKEIREIHPWRFYNMTSVRPIVTIKKGIVEKYEPQSIKVMVANAESCELILFLGYEPQINWDLSSDEILRILEDYGTQVVILLGGVLDRIPHTRDPIITYVTFSSEASSLAKRVGAEPSEYIGLSSFHTFLLNKLNEKGILSLSLWGHAPYYADSPYLRTSCKLISMLSSILNIHIPLAELKIQADVQLRMLDEKVKADPQLFKEVRDMEVSYDMARKRPPYAA